MGFICRIVGRISAAERPKTLIIDWSANFFLPSANYSDIKLGQIFWRATVCPFFSLRKLTRLQQIDWLSRDLRRSQLPTGYGGHHHPHAPLRFHQSLSDLKISETSGAPPYGSDGALLSCVSTFQNTFIVFDGPTGIGPRSFDKEFPLAIAHVFKFHKDADILFKFSGVPASATKRAYGERVNVLVQAGPRDPGLTQNVGNVFCFNILRTSPLDNAGRYRRNGRQPRPLFR